MVRLGKWTPIRVGKIYEGRGTSVVRRTKLIRGGGRGGVFPLVCNNEDEDEDKDEENDNKTIEDLTNHIVQRLFIGESTRPRPPPSSYAGPLIIIMPGPRMKGIDSCDEDGHGRAHDTCGHDGE